MFSYQVSLGADGGIRLPDEILQHFDLHPGQRLELLARPDGILEISALSDQEYDPETILQEDFSLDEIRAAQTDMTNSSR